MLRRYAGHSRPRSFGDHNGDEVTDTAGNDLVPVVGWIDENDRLQMIAAQERCWRGEDLRPSHG